MHQFRVNVFRVPFVAASSLMSNPMEPYSLDTWLGGFPAETFSRIVFPEAVLWIRMPFVLPVTLLNSITLPLLAPMRPIPKSLLDATVGAPAQSATAQTEPLPPNRPSTM